MNKGRRTIAIYLDLEKAFDTVDHFILANKLYRYGIRGRTLELIINYLTDRT